MRDRGATWSWWMMGLVLLGFVVGLRVWDLGVARLWADELYSIRFSNGHGLDELPGARWSEGGLNTMRLPEERLIGGGMLEFGELGRVMDAVAEDTHPPLYPVVLRAWREVVGESEVSMRVLSLLFAGMSFVGLIGAVRGSVMDRLGVMDRVGLVDRSGMDVGCVWLCVWMSVLLAGVSVPWVMYATEVRSYGMLIGFSMVGLWACISGVRSRGLGGRVMWAMVLGVSTLLCAWTHYAGIVMSLGMGLWLLVQRDRRGWMGFVAMGLGGLMFALTWGGVVLEQRERFRTNLAWLDESPQGHVVRTIGRVMESPARMMMRQLPEVGSAGGSGLVAGDGVSVGGLNVWMLSLPVVVVCVWMGRRGWRGGVRLNEDGGSVEIGGGGGVFAMRGLMWLWAGLAILPVLQASWSDVLMNRRGLVEARYLVLGVGPMCGLLGMSVGMWLRLRTSAGAGLGGWWKVAGVWVLVVLVLVGVWGNVGRFSNPPLGWDRLARQIDGVWREGSSLLVVAPSGQRWMAESSYDGVCAYGEWGWSGVWLGEWEEFAPSDVDGRRVVVLSVLGAWERGMAADAGGDDLLDNAKLGRGLPRVSRAASVWVLEGE